MTRPVRPARDSQDTRSTLRTGWAQAPIPGTVEAWTRPTDRAGRGVRRTRHADTGHIGEAQQ
ncbi:hypothetical protein U9R90_27625 [Streptomyces sp. E11-3]|uniref:hypothetical protein n=1 Tax=Streptomyces sp. E11-3 TaxID=3110112 RepID=UPI00397FC8FC